MEPYEAFTRGLFAIAALLFILVPILPMFQIVSREAAVVVVAVFAIVSVLALAAYTKPKEMRWGLTFVVGYVALEVNAIQTITA